MLIAVAFGLLSVALLERIRRERIATKIEFHAFKLYALRDKLRAAAIRGEVRSAHWVFSYLDSSIAKTIGLLPRLNLILLVGIGAIHRRDERAAMASMHLHRELEKSSNEFLRRVHEEYIEIIVSLMLARHPLIRGFVSLASRPNNKESSMRRDARMVVESPEASTLDDYVDDDGLRLAS